MMDSQKNGIFFVEFFEGWKKSKPQDTRRTYFSGYRYNRDRVHNNAILYFSNLFGDATIDEIEIKSELHDGLTLEQQKDLIP